MEIAFPAAEFAKFFGGGPPHPPAHTGGENPPYSIFRFFAIFALSCLGRRGIAKYEKIPDKAIFVTVGGVAQI